MRRRVEEAMRVDSGTDEESEWVTESEDQSDNEPD